jgi:hypothetical protein
LRESWNGEGYNFSRTKEAERESQRNKDRWERCSDPRVPKPRLLETRPPYIHLLAKSLEMDAPHPPPPGTNYLAVIKPPFDVVLTAHTFTIFLITLLISLFYFSGK